MSVFSAAELAMLQQTQLRHMPDTCQVLQYTAGAADDYGKPVVTYTPGETSLCGFKPTRKREGMGGGQVPLVDAQLRLPQTVTVASQDRIKLTHRHGVALAEPVTFEIVGLTVAGPSARVLELQRVTDGSDA